MKFWVSYYYSDLLWELVALAVAVLYIALCTNHTQWSAAGTRPAIQPASQPATLKFSRLLNTIIDVADQPNVCWVCDWWWCGLRSAVIIPMSVWRRWRQDYSDLIRLRIHHQFANWITANRLLYNIVIINTTLCVCVYLSSYRFATLSWPVGWVGHMIFRRQFNGVLRTMPLGDFNLEAMN